MCMSHETLFSSKPKLNLRFLPPQATQWCILGFIQNRKIPDVSLFHCCKCHKNRASTIKQNPQYRSDQPPLCNLAELLLWVLQLCFLFCFSVSALISRLLKDHSFCWAHLSKMFTYSCKHACHEYYTAQSSVHLQFVVKWLMHAHTRWCSNMQTGATASTVQQCYITLCVFVCVCGSCVHSLWRMGKKNGDVSNYITDFAANLRWMRQRHTCWYTVPLQSCSVRNAVFLYRITSCPLTYSQCIIYERFGAL